jgi:hypothetical protein
MALNGTYRDVPIPRSNIYVSSNSGANKGSVKQKYKFQSDVSSFHFFLVLKTGDLYTQEDIEECKGKYSCHNCHRKIMHKIYFYPEIFNPQTNEATCNPIPHCRTACLYRTVQDMPNNADLLTNLFLMYGHEIICAPERFLLSIPGGLSEEQYHKVIDDNLLIRKEEPYIRSFHAPIYISCTLFKDHQFVPDTVSFIDEMMVERKNAIGPSRIRDNSDLQVLELEPKQLTHTKLSEMFNFEPSSFNRGPELDKNPHMGLPPQQMETDS